MRKGRGEGDREDETEELVKMTGEEGNGRVEESNGKGERGDGKT